MKKIISTLLTFAFFTTLLHGEEPTFLPLLPSSSENSAEKELPSLETYQFLYDNNFTPFAGGENLLTLHRGIQNLQKKSPLKDQEGLVPSLARAGELLLGWTPLNYMTMVVQHEVFGHGYRIRDSGKENAFVTKYVFHLPPPFGKGGAATHYRYNKDISPILASVIAGGGMEATGVLAHQIRMGWVKTGMVPVQEASLYNLSHSDIYLYIHSLQSDDKLLKEPEGHDVAAYLKILRINYPKGHLTGSDLKKMARLQFFDPFTYLTIISSFKYVFTGCETSLPMFTFKSLSYLPSPRLTLSPFGPDLRLDNYFKYKDVPTYTYVKIGKFAGNRFWGAGFLNESLFTYKAHAFGARLDVWQQPKILTRSMREDSFSDDPHASVLQSTMRPGAAGSLIYNYALFPERLAIHIELGYKSKGYLTGESLSEGLLARLALNARF